MGLFRFAFVLFVVLERGGGGDPARKATGGGGGGGGRERVKHFHYCTTMGCSHEVIPLPSVSNAFCLTIANLNTGIIGSHLIPGSHFI